MSEAKALPAVAKTLLAMPKALPAVARPYQLWQSRVTAQSGDHFYLILNIKRLTPKYGEIVFRRDEGVQLALRDLVDLQPLRVRDDRGRRKTRNQHK